MSEAAPCSGEPDLFQSTKLDDHREARELCVRCPLSQRCRALVVDDKLASGTYGGHLFRKGELVTVP